WIVGSGGYVGYTEDGGKTWRRQSAGKAYLRDVYFVNDNIGWVVGEDATIMHTEDGGKTWEQQDSGIEGTITRVQFVSSKLGYAAANNGRILRYESQQ
ncbi:MAG: YCF48-related protein, partial [Acidobacteriota bacterium]